MNINELPGNVLYIEDAFPMSNIFLNELEVNDNNPKISSVITPWQGWLSSNEDLKGYYKNFDWDYSINKNNNVWPRIKIDPDHSDQHKLSYDIIKMIDDPLRDVVDIWSEKTANPKIDWITKNYTVKKYNTYQNIVSHSDRGSEENTFDWTALVYLNDNYSGGELMFDNLGYEISPKAGSIVFFSTDEVHTAKPVMSGNKSFMFFYIQSRYGFMHSYHEESKEHVRHIREDLSKINNKDSTTN